MVYLHSAYPTTLQAVRGARLAVLSVRDWIDADKLSDAELRRQIAEHGQTSISVESLRPLDGPRQIGKDGPRIVVAVETAEKRLAVAILQSREFSQLERQLPCPGGCRRWHRTARCEDGRRRRRGARAARRAGRGERRSARSRSSWS